MGNIIESECEEYFLTLCFIRSISVLLIMHFKLIHERSMGMKSSITALFYLQIAQKCKKSKVGPTDKLTDRQTKGTENEAK